MKILFRLLPCALLLAPISAQTTWYVDALACDGTGQGTFDDPYCTIQEGIDAAQDGDTVLVGPGTYAEHLVLGARSSILRARDPGLAPPLIGDVGSEEVPLMSVPPGASVELEHLRFRAGRPAIAADGAMLTIRDCRFEQNRGRADGYGCSEGGAIVAESTQLTLLACQLENNLAGTGGAIASYGCQLTIEGCTFLRNYLDYCDAEGGALYAGGGEVVIRSTVFRDQLATEYLGNTAYFYGTQLAIEDTLFENGGGSEGYGTVFVNRSSGSFRRCRFIDNDIHLGQGGALLVTGEPTHALLVEDCDFVGNSADEGGALDLHGGTSTFVRCRFEGNESFSTSYPEHGDGGAAYLYAAAYATFRRCVFVDNQALGTPGGPGYGGAIFGACSAESCTFYRNRTDAGEGGRGGALAAGSEALASIFWHNVPDQLYAVGSIAYCLVEGDWWGWGNFGADPLLWGPVSGDMHLLAGSPCIDAGPGGMHDEDGSRLDVGAFAYDAGYCGLPGRYCTAKQSAAGCLPAMSSSGTPSLSGPDDFHVLAEQVPPSRFGLLLWSVAGASEQPFFGGLLCLAAPLVRSSVQLSSGGSEPCEGVFDYHFSQARMGAEGLLPGTHLYLQWWYRDPSHPDGTGVGLSDALEATICN